MDSQDFFSLAQPVQRKEPLSLGQKEKNIFLILSLLGSFFYCICFSGFSIYPQFSFTLFCITALVAVPFALKHLGYYQNRKALWIALPIVAIALCNTLFPLSLFTYTNVILMYFLFALYVLTACQQEGTTISTFTYFGLLFRVVFSDIRVFFQALRQTTPGEAKAKNQTLFKILIGVLIAVPVLFFIVLLLADADVIFRKLTDDVTIHFFQLDAFRIGNLFNFAFAFMYIYGYFYNAKNALKNKKERALPSYRADVIIASTFLILINLVFLLFSFIQFTFLFTGGLLSLPDGMIYSEYAREGFFQLLFVTLINFSVLFIFLSIFKPCIHQRFLRTLLFGLCFFTLVLIFSSFYRMFLYMSEYGFTPLRWMVVTFLVMELVLLYRTILHLLKGNTPYFRKVIFTGLFFYILVNFTGSTVFSDFLNQRFFYESATSSEYLRTDSSEFHYWQNWHVFDMEIVSSNFTIF